MKKTTLLLASVAFLSFGSASSWAQIQINGEQPRTLQRLVVAQTGVGETEDEPAAAQEVIPNPFDFFASEDPSSMPSVPAELRTTPVVDEVAASPSDVDPQSLSVGRRHRQQSMTETILDHGTVAAIPHTAMAPVCWSASDQTPNPIANILLRQDCNQQALWNGYSAQRAAECARMWRHLSGEHRCGHGGKCGQGCECASGAVACAPATRNRYTEHLPAHPHQATPACDVLTPAVHGHPPTPAPQAELQSSADKSDATNTASLQPIAPPSAEPFNVASLPTYFNR